MPHRLLVPETLDAEIAAAVKRKSTASSELNAELAARGALDAPIARRELLDTIETLQSTLVTVVRHVVDNAEAELVRLAAKLAALEEKRTMSFCGAHDPGRAYAAGEVTQRANSLWIAMAPTKVGDVPGSHASWREIGRCK